MRKLLLGLLGSVLFATACTAPAAGSSNRPNSAHSMTNAQQAQPKDPHDYVMDPTIGVSPSRNTDEKPICRLQCAPGTHCDASGMVERCVRDEPQKP